jgi:hypothetical protein
MTFSGSSSGNNRHPIFIFHLSSCSRKTERTELLPVLILQLIQLKYLCSVLKGTFV